jgi:hypothetical protein
MGRASALSTRRPELQVQFADVERDTAGGNTTAWEATELRTPPPSEIPTYTVRRSFPDIGYDRANPDFYREVSRYTAFHVLFRPVRLVVENNGSTPADDVRVEIEVDETSGVSLKENQPDEPTRTLRIAVGSEAVRLVD